MFYIIVTWRHCIQPVHHTWHSSQVHHTWHSSQVHCIVADSIPRTKLYITQSVNVLSNWEFALFACYKYFSCNLWENKNIFQHLSYLTLWDFNSLQWLFYLYTVTSTVMQLTYSFFRCQNHIWANASCNVSFIYVWFYWQSVYC